MESKFLILFDFTGRTLCVGTPGSIIQPKLGDDFNQKLDQVYCSFKANKTPVIVRYTHKIKFLNSLLTLMMTE